MYIKTVDRLKSDGTSIQPLYVELLVEHTLNGNPHSASILALKMSVYGDAMH